MVTEIIQNSILLLIIPLGTIALICLICKLFEGQ